MKLTPNITLSNGRVIGSRYAENGSQDLFDVADPEQVANLTEAEHAEVMAAIREFRNPVIRRTRSCDNCGNTLTDPDEILCDKCKNPPQKIGTINHSGYTSRTTLKSLELYDTKLQTFQYQIGEPGCDLDPTNWKEIEACTMRDAVIPALQREAKTRKVPMPSIVYLSGLDDFKHSNGAPFAVHAFEVTQ